MDWAHERYFLSYRGTRLPLQLTEALGSDALTHRNTYFRARHDTGGRRVSCDKLVCGEVDMSHRHEYDAGDHLHSAAIAIGDEAPRLMRFDGVSAP